MFHVCLEPVDVDNPGDQEVIHQLLGYESMRGTRPHMETTFTCLYINVEHV